MLHVEFPPTGARSEGCFQFSALYKQLPLITVPNLAELDFPISEISITSYYTLASPLHQAASPAEGGTEQQEIWKLTVGNWVLTTRALIHSVSEPPQRSLNLSKDPYGGLALQNIQAQRVYYVRELQNLKRLVVIKR